MQSPPKAFNNAGPVNEGSVMEEKENEEMAAARFMGAGIGIGVGVGAALGVALGSIALGVGVGIGIGVAVGAALGAAKR